MLLFLKPAEVRSIANISTSIPLFFCIGTDLESHFSELLHEESLSRQHETYEPLHNEIHQAVALKGVENFPYEEFCVVLAGVGFDKGHGDRSYNLIIHIAPNTSDRGYKAYLMNMVDVSRITKDIIGPEDQARFDQWISSCVMIATSMFVKKNVVSVVQGPTITKTSKGKIKRVKAEYTILSSKRYLPRIKSVQSGKIIRAFSPHSVCGHWRHFWINKNNPYLGLKQDVVGRDRDGDMVVGKTWINPYKKGNTDIDECIRVWRKY